MSNRADILLFGTGSFAARILFDIAATAGTPVKVAVAGRRTERLGWLRTAAEARADMFRRPVRVSTLISDIVSAQSAAEAIAEVSPRVVVQAASAQGGAVIAARNNAWAQLVAEGGLSATAVFQALLSARAAQGLAQSGISAFFVNCCYADVTNSILAALGLPVTTGIGNVSILAHAFGGLIGPGEGRLKLLAHYQTIGAFRMPPAERSGPMPRVWLDGKEIDDVASRFAAVQLTPEPVIDISGASGVPMLLAMASGAAWAGHAPGPLGLPGGYPVRLDQDGLKLDLPPGLSREEAVAWNASFEEKNGLVVEADGRARYTGKLAARLRVLSPDLARGFNVKDLDQVFAAMSDLRARLACAPAA
ncbi:MAG: hypothetical protein F9K44_14285 [Hyphomicrobiaceae bacterium]|nr:MAG: hypothetical protein F9K44_14285 [Hyphomicrobiaceae bacterium]